MDEGRIVRDQGIDKRKHTRYLAKKLTFVKLGSENEEDIGQLLDISKSGLSMRYFTNEKHSQNFSDLDIFLPDGVFNIEKIPIKVVSDLERGKTPSGKQTLRRYGIQFEMLTPKQAAKLDHFLLNHTLGEA